MYSSNQRKVSDADIWYLRYERERDFNRDLMKENNDIRAELSKLREENEELRSENVVLHNRLSHLCDGY